MYFRPDYNMMLSLANVQRSRSRMETPYVQSGIDDLLRATQNQINLQQLFNRQFAPVDNQYTNWALSFPLRYDANHLEILNSNQLMPELEKLKSTLRFHRPDPIEEGVRQAIRNEEILKQALINEVAKKKAMPNVFDETFHWKDTMKAKGWNLPQLVVNNDKCQQSEVMDNFPIDAEELNKLLDLGESEDVVEKSTLFRPDSPCSNCSSGIGSSLPSPLCDVQSPLEFEQRLLSSTPLPTAEEEIEAQEEIEAVNENWHTAKDIVMYQGRNILDLHTNLTYQWSFQMAILPKHTLQNHVEYRSLYHRLSPFGMAEDWHEQKCPLCAFDMIIPKQ